MSIDKFLKELDRAQKALKSLEGTFAQVHFNPDDPRSINAAILKMEAEVDRRVSYSRGNSFVAELVAAVKAGFAEQIREKAAQHRAEQQSSEDYDDMAADAMILRQIENTVDDLKWAEHNTFNRHIKRLSQLLHSEGLASDTDELLEKVDLPKFLEESHETQGGMVGSAHLVWPDEHEQQLGLTIALIDKMATEDRFADNFSHVFFYDRNFTRCLQNMTGQMIVPFARDYIDHVKSIKGIEETAALPQRVGDPNARKVFVVHGHDEGARESVARFLERLNFEAFGCPVAYGYTQRHFALVYLVHKLILRFG